MAPSSGRRDVERVEYESEERTERIIVRQPSNRPRPTQAPRPSQRPSEQPVVKIPDPPKVEPPDVPDVPEVKTPRTPTSVPELPKLPLP